ncbi:MAG: hypothetical protein ACTSR3_13765 [Candidatus Helarchaeota archaeon]
MRDNQDFLFAVSLYSVIIGFIYINNHHNINYIEQVFYLHSIGGEHVKATCYNLMIPIEINSKRTLIMSNAKIYTQKEIKQSRYLDFATQIVIIYVVSFLLDVLIKKYLSSLLLKGQNSVLCKKMNAFSVKNSEKKKERKKYMS